MCQQQIKQERETDIYDPSDVTGRRINLLRKWARLRLAELAAAAGPSQGTNSNAVINVAP